MNSKNNIVEYLLNNGALVDALDQNGSTALLLGIFDIYIVDRNFKNENIIFKATHQGHLETAKILITHKANVNKQNNFGHSSLIKGKFDSGFKSFRLS